MSIDIDWERLTGGPDGAALADSIRSFIHDKFQEVTLPRFIRSVHIHSFDLGSVAPTIELKDICDPLPDFYEEDDDDGDDTASSDGVVDGDEPLSAQTTRTELPSSDLNDPYRRARASHQDSHPPTTLQPPSLDTRLPSFRAAPSGAERLPGPPPSGALTPGIPGGTSNLSYFHLPLGAGLSGTTTPLAAVAGAQFQGAWPDANRARDASAAPVLPRHHHHHSASTSSLSPPSTADDPASRPSSQHQREPPSRPSRTSSEAFARATDAPSPPPSPRRTREPSAEDVQIVAHVRYAGDVQLSLTAEILLDYPMEHFVGIPLQLRITGVAFDGVALLAHIRRRAHVCFLAPADGAALVGEATARGTAASEAGEDGGEATTTVPGGLLEEIKVESEIGQREGGRQVLKNVGKVERFVLDQVRRIFEEEFVYPSFWTFLV